MKKKISILAIALTILFGGVFASSASAAASDQAQGQQNYSYKVFYSFNGWSDYFSGNDWWKNSLLNRTLMIRKTIKNSQK